MDEISFFSATELTAAYAAKTLSPVEAARSALSAIARHDGRLNAFRLFDETAALDAARQSEARWQRGQPLSPIDGVPASVKDLLLTKGWPTLRGSLNVDPDQPWEEDAPAVARLREAGAVLLGKTNTPEFGWKGTTDSPLAGITRNPWNPDMTPGGSSGGAAAALASGMGALALGTDGGGSIRIPSSFSGLCGLKPTFGRVPAYPPSPAGTLANVGPMARSVPDLALMMNVIAKPDARDWLSLPHNATDYRSRLDEGVAGLRIAYSPDLGFAKVDAEVARHVASAAQIFSGLGAIVEEIDPGVGDCAEVFYTHWHVALAGAFGDLPPERLDLMDPGLLDLVMTGKAIPIGMFIEAQNERIALGRQMRMFYETYDLLILPSTAVAAFPVGRGAPKGMDDKDWAAWTPFTYPFNLTMQPAASVPAGLTDAGLPVGLQIVGGMYADDLVLRAARAFENATPFGDQLSVTHVLSH